MSLALPFAGAFSQDPFPESEHAPLISEAVEAAATRVAICAPDQARGLVPTRDLTTPVLRHIALDALAAHRDGQAWNSQRLFHIAGVPWSDAVQAYFWYDLDAKALVNPAAVREARNLSAWRTLRTLFLRGASACESMRVQDALRAVDAANEALVSARGREGRAA